MPKNRLFLDEPNALRQIIARFRVPSISSRRRPDHSTVEPLPGSDVRCKRDTPHHLDTPSPPRSNRHTGARMNATPRTVDKMRDRRSETTPSFGWFALAAMALLAFSSTSLTQVAGSSSSSPTSSFPPRLGTRTSTTPAPRFWAARHSATLSQAVLAGRTGTSHHRPSLTEGEASLASTPSLARRQQLHRQRKQREALLTRGGAVEEDDQDDNDEEIEAEVEIGVEVDVEEDDDVSDEEDEFFDEDEEEDVAMVESVMMKSDKSAPVYVDPYFMSPMMQIYTTIGTILLTRKIDMFNPRIVRTIRCVVAFPRPSLVPCVPVFLLRRIGREGTVHFSHSRAMPMFSPPAGFSSSCK